MAGERRKLYKDAAEEKRAKEAAAAERRSSGNIWGLLGGVLATVLTGGAASPLLSGIAYAGGTYLGHKYGVSRSKTDEALAGGKFYQESGPEMMALIDEEGISSALKGGIGYGFAQYGQQALAAKIGGMGGKNYIPPKSSGIMDFYNSPIGKYFTPKSDDIVSTGSSFPMGYESLFKDLPSANVIKNRISRDNTSWQKNLFPDEGIFQPVSTRRS